MSKRSRAAIPSWILALSVAVIVAVVLVFVLVVTLPPSYVGLIEGPLRSFVTLL